MSNQIINTSATLSGSKSSEDLQAWYYNRYALDNHYTYDSGRIVLPVAGPDGTAPRVITTHASIGYRKAKFDAMKSGNPPWFPEIGVDTPSGDIFLTGSLDIPLPILGSNQSSYIFKTGGEYRFVQPGKPRDSDDVFQTGYYPFATPLIDFWQTLYPSFNTAGVSITPDWSTDDWIWTNESIAGFFMDGSLIS